MLFHMSAVPSFREMRTDSYKAKNNKFPQQMAVEVCLWEGLSSGLVDSRCILICMLQKIHLSTSKINVDGKLKNGQI